MRTIALVLVLLVVVAAASRPAQSQPATQEKLTRWYLLAAAARTVDLLGGLDEIRQRGCWQDYLDRYDLGRGTTYEEVREMFRRTLDLPLPHNALARFIPRDMRWEASAQWLRMLDEEREWGEHFAAIRRKGPAAVKRYLRVDDDELRERAAGIASLLREEDKSEP